MSKPITETPSSNVPIVVDEIAETDGSVTVGAHMGQVKWWNDRLGFGFITILENGEDVFVHYSGIKPNISNYRTLQRGEYVQFDTTASHNGKQAIRVTGIRGGDLLCDIRRRVSANDDSKDFTPTVTG